MNMDELKSTIDKIYDDVERAMGYVEDARDELDSVLGFIGELNIYDDEMESEGD